MPTTSSYVTPQVQDSITSNSFVATPAVQFSSLDLPTSEDKSDLVSIKKLLNPDYPLSSNTTTLLNPIVLLSRLQPSFTNPPSVTFTSVSSSDRAPTVPYVEPTIVSTQLSTVNPPSLVSTVTKEGHFPLIRSTSSSGTLHAASYVPIWPRPVLYSHPIPAPWVNPYSPRPGKTTFNHWYRISYSSRNIYLECATFINRLVILYSFILKSKVLSPILNTL